MSELQTLKWLSEESLKSKYLPHFHEGSKHLLYKFAPEFLDKRLKVVEST